MRISDWSSDVCSSDLPAAAVPEAGHGRGLRRGQRALRRDLGEEPEVQEDLRQLGQVSRRTAAVVPRRGRHLRQLHGVDHHPQAEEEERLIPALILDSLKFRQSPASAGLFYWAVARSEEHTSELPSLMRISYAVFCLTKKLTTHCYDRPEHSKLITHHNDS